MNLSDFLSTDYWNAWRHDNYSSLGFNDPDRAERVWNAAEHGADGSTHGEVIDDMRKAINDAYSDNFLGQGARDAILDEIDAVEEWHIENGSIDRELG